jgi:hypothetical protein
MSRAQQSVHNDLITLDEFSDEAESSLKYWIIYTMWQNRKLTKRGGRAMTNQQLADAWRRDPAFLLSDGDKIISYEEALKLAEKGRYVQKMRVKFNMQTAAKVGVQREYYNSGWCTMDAVIAHISEIDLKKTQDKNGKWGFTATLLPDAEREAIRVLTLCEAVKCMRDVAVTFKTKLCEFHLFGKDGCVNGGRCHFAHSKTELRSLAPPSLTQPSPRKPAKPAPPTLAPWFRQAKSDASPIQLLSQEPAPLAPPAPPALWFLENTRDASC